MGDPIAAAFDLYFDVLVFAVGLVGGRSVIDQVIIL
jgi:hypothetical protein